MTKRKPEPELTKAEIEAWYKEHGFSSEDKMEQEHSRHWYSEVPYKPEKLLWSSENSYWINDFGYGVGDEPENSHNLYTVLGSQIDIKTVFNAAIPDAHIAHLYELKIIHGQSYQQLLTQTHYKKTSLFRKLKWAHQLMTQYLRDTYAYEVELGLTLNTRTETDD